MFTLLIPSEPKATKSGSFSTLNSNAAFTANALWARRGGYTNLSGFIYGVGYNISKHNSVLGEVMWNGLSPTGEALAPIRAALQNDHLNGHGNLAALTANYKLAI